GGAALNLHGLDRLARIQALLPRTAFPLVIERTPGCPPLAEGRRAVVLNELALGPFPIPAERVVIGPPLALGQRGVEAGVLSRNLIIQTQSSGIPGGGLGTGGASFGGSQGIFGTTSSGLMTPPPQ